MARFSPGSGPVDRARAIRTLEGEGLRVTEWTDEPGETYHEHRHTHREVRIVLAGEMSIEANGLRYQLGPGDRIDLEPDEMHSSVVGVEGVSYLAGSDGAAS